MDIVSDLKNQFLSYYDKIVVLLPKLLLAIVVAVLLMTILKYFRKKLVKYLQLKAEDKLLVNFFDGVLYIFNIVIVALLTLYILGLSGIAGSLLGAATLSSVVIGFAFKDIAENFLAGVIMAFNRPFRLGDTVKTADVEGVIIEMSLRDTHIKTFDGKDVYVPNGQIIKNPLYNYTIDGFLRGSFTIGVDYNSDIEAARSIILSILKSTAGILQTTKPPRTHVKTLNSSTIDIEVHYWVDTFDKSHSGLEIKSQAQTKIVRALSDAGISMPSNIVELINHNSQKTNV